MVTMLRTATGCRLASVPRDRDGHSNRMYDRGCQDISNLPPAPCLLAELTSPERRYVDTAGIDFSYESGKSFGDGSNGPSRCLRIDPASVTSSKAGVAMESTPAGIARPT